MYATDFLFDGRRASDLGLMVCSFNGEFETATGGDIEYNVVKTPDRDKFNFYGSQLNSVITWNFSICKIPCKNDNMYFDQYEESQIAKWLIKTDGYRWFQFDQDGYEDIFYNVLINMTPHQISGQTVGFDLTVTSDCGYGFTDIITRKAIINSSTPLKLNVHSDIKTYILPCIKIISCIGNFYISNDNDKSQNNAVGKATKLKIESNYHSEEVSGFDVFNPPKGYESKKDKTGHILNGWAKGLIHLGSFIDYTTCTFTSDGFLYIVQKNGKYTFTTVGEKASSYNIISDRYDYYGQYDSSTVGGDIFKEFSSALLNPEEVNDIFVTNIPIFDSSSLTFENDVKKYVDNGDYSAAVNVDAIYTYEYSVKEIIMDSEEDTILMKSDDNTLIEFPNPNNFNWYFLRLVDGENTITTDSVSDIEMEIQYREPRRVII